MKEEKVALKFEITTEKQKNKRKNGWEQKIEIEKMIF